MKSTLAGTQLLLHNTMTKVNIKGAACGLYNVEPLSGHCVHKLPENTPSQEGTPLSGSYIHVIILGLQKLRNT